MFNTYKDTQKLSNTYMFVGWEKMTHVTYVVNKKPFVLNKKMAYFIQIINARAKYQQ